MSEYHVSCGMFGIYAGTVKKNGTEWKDKTRVTDEAIEAVRDWLRKVQKWKFDCAEQCELTTKWFYCRVCGGLTEFRLGA